MDSFISVTTQILKEKSYKMHVATLKNIYYKDFFKHDQVLVLTKSNPFKIYWVCKLFEEC